MRRFAEYDPFAWLYQQHWGREYHDQAYAVLDRLVLSRLKPRAAILDLCCGDGRLTAALASSGFHMTGLDGSAKMLGYARKRAPRIPFLLGDARDFAMPKRFDAVISTFDALNHVMSGEELAAVCRCVWRVLKPGGFFAFDLNREEAYTDLWSGTASTVEADNVSVARGSYDPAAAIAICDVTLFRLHSGQWRRSDFRLSQKCHPEREVLNALSSAGFRHLEARDAFEDLGMHGNIGRGRTYYLARKTGRARERREG